MDVQKINEITRKIMLCDERIESIEKGDIREAVIRLNLSLTIFIAPHEKELLKSLLDTVVKETILRKECLQKELNNIIKGE